MSTNKIQTGLRLKPVTLEKLTYLARKDKRSLNNLVETIVERYIEQIEEENGVIPTTEDFGPIE